MNIKTKYDIGDEVYLIEGNGVIKNVIQSMAIFVNNNNASTVYGLTGNAEDFDEDQLFKATKELYNHIEKEIKKLNEDKNKDKEK